MAIIKSNSEFAGTFDVDWNGNIIQVPPMHLTCILGDFRGADGRSGGWRKVEREHLAEQPLCQVCDGKKLLQVHHMVPFHVDKALELDPKNLITLCEPHHLLAGHGMCWRDWIEDCVKFIGIIRKQIEGRNRYGR